MVAVQTDEDRILRASALGDLPAAEALTELVALLGDPLWRVRHAAVDALVRLRPARSVAEALVDSVSDPEDAGRRNAALTALSRLGPDALPVLARIAAAPGADHRKLAVDALGLLGLPDAVPTLAERLLDTDTNVRAAAAEALGRVADVASARVLEAHLVDHPPADPLETSTVLLGLARAHHAPPWATLAPLLEDPMVRTAAITVVPFSQAPEAPSALLDALQSRLGTLRAAALSALCSAGTAAPAVAALLQKPVMRDEVRRGAVELLGTRDEEAASSAAAVASWVADAHTAAVLLSQRAGRPWDAAVAEAWRNGGPDAGLHVAQGLMRLEPEDQALALELMEEHPDPRSVASLSALWPRVSGDTLERVARAWLAAEPVSALAPLARRMVDATAEPEDRDLCRRALSEAATAFPEPVRRAVWPLVQCGAVASSVAWVLARAAAPGDAPQFREWVRHPDADVRAAACDGLAFAGAHSDADAVLPLLMDEMPQVRSAAARAVGKLGTDAHADALAARVADEDPDVQRSALGALAALSPARASDAVLDLVGSSDARRAEGALAAAESLGGTTALAAGTRALSHPDASVVRAALRAGGSAGLAEAASTVAPLLRDGRWEVRHAAAQAATTLREAGRGSPALLAAAKAALEGERDPLVREALQVLLGAASGAPA